MDDKQNTHNSGCTSPIDQIEAYWTKLAKGFFVPFRREVEPAAMGPSLAHAFLADATDPDQIRFRFVGSRISPLAKFDVRGTPLTLIADPCLKMDLAGTLAQTVSVPAKVRFTLGRLIDGELTPELSVFCAPLRTDQGAVGRILGAMEPVSNFPGFGECTTITECSFFSLPKVPDATMGEPMRHPVTMREPGAAFEHKDQAGASLKAERSYLKLVR